MTPPSKSNEIVTKRRLELNERHRPYRVRQESFDTLTALWFDPGSGLRWEHPFMLPGWMAAWWQVFRQDHEDLICSFWQNEALLGIAPLMCQGQEARFIGNTQVFDYSDFVVCPGREEAFFAALIDHLRERGIIRLHLHGLRPDSTGLMHLVPMGRSLDCRTHMELEDVTVELQLPRSWAEYLYRLNGKQRHEVRRKLRRLEEAGDIRFRAVGAKDDLHTATATFLNLFGANRQDKADFMTDEMAGYFRVLIEALADLDLMKLYFLEIDRRPVAGVMCFDYRNRRYLYNSGYDLIYSRLSVGLLSKVLSIGEGIEAGCRIYDFLRGDEGYKYRLGGQSVPVHKCLIEV